MDLWFKNWYFLISFRYCSSCQCIDLLSFIVPQFTFCKLHNIYNCRLTILGWILPTAQKFLIRCRYIHIVVSYQKASVLWGKQWALLFFNVSLKPCDLGNCEPGPGIFSHWRVWRWKVHVHNIQWCSDGVCLFCFAYLRCNISRVMKANRCGSLLNLYPVVMVICKHDHAQCGSGARRYTWLLPQTPTDHANDPPQSFPFNHTNNTFQDN